MGTNKRPVSQGQAWPWSTSSNPPSSRPGGAEPRRPPTAPQPTPHLKHPGKVHREYAANRRALDLLVVYGPDRFVVEIKRVRDRDSLESVREAAIQQTLEVLDAVGEREGWILPFDQRKNRSWKQRLWTRTVERDGRRLRLFGA